MSQSAPVIYLLHGDDEFAIAQFVAEIEARLGDSATAAMNLTRLDGKSFNPDELLSVAGAMPFLSDRRVVILEDFLGRLNSPAARERFKENLEQVPATTAVLLIENRLLVDDSKSKPRSHWLVDWAMERPERVYLRPFALPRGPAMARWIQERARELGGQFSPPAAGVLANLISDNPRLADQEIHKLLTYVNYRRPVEPDDVETLTADVAEGDVFVLVDALGHRNGRQAMGMLHRLLEKDEPLRIFGMIVRQFRLLLLAREVLDAGGREREIASRLKVHPYVAGKIAAQARHFDLILLEGVFRRLLEIDEAIKTGEVPGDLALDTLVAAFAGS